MELEDQRVLVTGATAGIGQEAAKLFARRGAGVVISGRDTQRGAQTVAAIEAQGGRAEFIAANLNDIESVRRLAEQAGEIDVLVNNAAALAPRTTFEQDVESFDMMFDVDVRAPFFLTAALVPKMIARGSGAIVNISSMGASVGVPFAPATAAAKAALESFTRSWAAAFGANGIRVNTVAAGPTRTDSAIGTFGDALEQLGSATLLGRTADPIEIAEAIVFLASPQASYLTGATVAVDGGFTAV
ncbi:MAG: SDR family oxidoreductase [Mycobacterium sp.]|jgi:NAD(P)-dependent dehydrogenase (short-subunit alcohol dehydrogenase family)|uniref:SDR family NAD(P)-dependent oxidoreductase n=1 Tax=Mycobacterium sp. TaxID=1785 RepID=UPI003C74B840